MSWSIDIPFRDRSDSLTDAGFDVRHLPDPDDRATVRQVLAMAFHDGLGTVGDLLDRLEAASPEERRSIIDRARIAADLPSVTEIETSERVEREQLPKSGLERRDESGFTEGLCCAAGCGSFKVDTITGGIAKTNVRRWACDEHKDQGDFEPWARRLAYSPSGAIVDLDVVDAERARAVLREKTLAARRESEHADRSAKIAAAQEEERARADLLRSETPPGFSVPR